MRISDWSSDVCSSDLGATIVGLFLVSSIVSAILVGPDEDEATSIGPPATIVTEEGETIEMPRPRSRLRIEEEDPTAAPLVNMLGLPLILSDLVFLGDRKSTRMNSSNYCAFRLQSSA